MKLSDEFKVGLFASITIVILILGFNFLKGKDVFDTSDTLFANYRKIDGLSKANPVFMYGLQIGKVVNITNTYDEQDSIVITVEFSVSPDVKIPMESIAKISKPDIMSSMVVEVIPSKNQKTLVNDGDYLKGFIERSLTSQVTSVLNPIRHNAEKMIVSLNQTLQSINKALDKNAQQDIRNGIKNFSETAKGLKTLVNRSESDLKQILGDMKGIASKVHESSAKLDLALANINTLTTTLNDMPLESTVVEAKATLGELKTLLEALNSTEGSMGLMINDPEFYKNINETLDGIKVLVEDLKKHPKSYFSPLGKKNND